jgi:hypothetical protein
VTRKRGRHASPAKKAAGQFTLGGTTAGSVAADPPAAVAGGRTAATGGPVASRAPSVMQSTFADVTLPDITAVAALVSDDTVVRRTKNGWRVGSDDLPDLTSAMILADLLAAENGTAQAPPPKPASQPDAASEAGRLSATVTQLEHALATRIRVEQAIGVLAERHRIRPRQAFEQLR